MKRILMIGTGGTIASGKTAEGLMPELTSEQLLSFVPAVSALCRAECLQLLSLDMASPLFKISLNCFLLSIIHHDHSILSKLILKDTHMLIWKM